MANFLQGKSGLWNLSQGKHQQTIWKFLSQSTPHWSRGFNLVPAHFFSKDPKCACGHVIEDKHHLIYQCSKWRKIRQSYFPANVSNIALPQLLQSISVRSGLEIILKQRLEEALSAIEDNLQ
ncbi:hypothetical protein CDAR_205991 [Caerostris darwini]|uniref:Reverse transcriptase zinc-binding domain-containing protein n=1 Tax=Caerostris darwini TaxID=1538125 RepID=A0AAV4MU14_9ARAC|nr:hypothetical protein CDAR_205991 [Caerostris darwini]